MESEPEDHLVRLLDGEAELFRATPAATRDAARVLSDHGEAVYPLAHCDDVLDALQHHSMSLQTITLYVTNDDGSLTPDGWEEMPERASDERRHNRATKYLERCRKHEGRYVKAPYYLAFFFVERT
jgi:hypothetical protein